LRERTGSVLPGVAPSNAYPTADGSDVLIAGNADSVFARLCSAMNSPELAIDDRYATHAARGEHMEELDTLIGEWSSTMATDNLLELLSSHGVPAGRVYTAADSLQDPHYLARNMVIQATNRAGVTMPMTGIVPKFSRTPGGISDVGPRLGEHTEDILRQLGGVDDTEWAALQSSGIVG